MSEIPDGYTSVVKEIANQLRLVADGEITPKFLERSWHDTFAGDVPYQVGDWKIVIFNDCDGFDYVDSAIAPDGTKHNFEDWQNVDYEYVVEPTNLLDQEEFKRLYDALVGAEAA